LDSGLHVLDSGFSYNSHHSAAIFLGVLSLLRQRAVLCHDTHDVVEESSGSGGKGRK